MRSIKFFIPVIVIFLTGITLYGQNLNKLDSLKVKLTQEKSDTGKIVLLYRISYELQFSDLALSEKYANDALDESERIHFRKGTGNSLIQLGNIRQQKGENIKAEEYYLKALEILREADDLEGIAICYNNMGIISHNKNDLPGALRYYRKSVEINRKTGKIRVEASSLYGIGTIYENQEKYDSALYYYFQAISLSESAGDNRLLAYGKMSLANVYFAMENYAQSLRYNEEAIVLLEKSENYFGLLKVYSALGQTAELLDTSSLAIWFYNQALKISEYVSSPSDQAVVYYSIARLKENTRDLDSARFNYEKSHLLFKNSGNRENEALSLIALARIQNYLYDFNTAKVLLTEALAIGEETQYPSVITSGYREMAMTYSGLKEFKKAFSYINKYSLLKDSLLTSEKQKQILELQTRFETEKKEKENIILRQGKKILQSARNFLIIGALLLILLAIVIYRSLTIKKRDNRILQQQKEEIKRQKEIVEQQKTSITDSIRYAKRIQSAMLPPQELVDQNIPDSFILYLPRDIVSGDFYWIRQLSESVILVCAADCTGHGVPGAFMSMLGMSLINDIVNLNEDQLITGEYTPADILNELRERIKKSLRQTGKEGEARDGMDISLCLIDKESRKIIYSGANNPVYIVSKEELTELKATRNPIGIYLSEKSFTNQVIEAAGGSVLYMFSDGYSDQIGSDGGKFLSKNFKQLLTKISDRPMSEIKETLHKTHTDWRKEEEQVDDILVAGIRI
jgi:serine phosphatase RsbU (regulator of sigma subunit)